MLLHAPIKHQADRSPNVSSLPKGKEAQDDFTVLHPLVQAILSNSRPRGDFPDLSEQRVPGQRNQEIVEWPSIDAVADFLSIQMLAARIQSFKNELANVAMLWKSFAGALE
jgi:hypothetical protein